MFELSFEIKRSFFFLFSFLVSKFSIFYVDDILITRVITKNLHFFSILMTSNKYKVTFTRHVALLTNMYLNVTRLNGITLAGGCLSLLM